MNTTGPAPTDAGGNETWESWAWTVRLTGAGGREAVGDAPPAPPHPEIATVLATSIPIVVLRIFCMQLIRPEDGSMNAVGARAGSTRSAAPPTIRARRARTHLRPVRATRRCMRSTPGGYPPLARGTVRYRGRPPSFEASLPS